MSTTSKAKPAWLIEQKQKQHALLKKNLLYITSAGIYSDTVNKKALKLLKEMDNNTMTTTTFKPSRRYSDVTRSVKAIIRYNFMDGKQVVYYNQGGRFFKVLDNMTIRPMSKTILNIHSLAKHWTNKSKVTIVEDDEQVLFNGEALDLPMDPFNINDRLEG